MGIIKYLYHQSNSLPNQRFNHFFLDIGENIHIHYRDIRIEFSAEEYIEFSRLFNSYDTKVLKEISEGYTDGILPNTNEKGTRKIFSTNKPLESDVKYHSNRIALEKCTDGFHLHFRNYKLLLDYNSFYQLSLIFKDAILEPKNINAGPIEILIINELSPNLVNIEYKSKLRFIEIEVPKQFYSKSISCLKSIGYELYKKTGLCNQLYLDNTVIYLKTPIEETQNIPIHSYLKNQALTLSPNQLNLFKLKLLNLFKQSEYGAIKPFKLDDLHINPSSLLPVIQKHSDLKHCEIKDEYEKLLNLYTQNKIFIVKPKKIPHTDDYRQKIRDRLDEELTTNIFSEPCVLKVHIFGRNKWKNMGRYEVPFVHYEWAKTDSDFDLHIEVEPDHENCIPDKWDRKFFYSPASSDYYHLRSIGEVSDKDFTSLFPFVDFKKHLIESYIFSHRTGDIVRMQNFLDSHGASLLFERKPELLDSIADMYRFKEYQFKRISISYHNKAYLLQDEKNEYFLKIYEEGALFPHEKDQNKIDFELSILKQLEGIEVAQPIKNSKGEYITYISGKKSILFPYVCGETFINPSLDQSFQSGKLLAQFHNRLLDFQCGNYNKNFDILPKISYWFSKYPQYINSGKTYNVPELSEIKKFFHSLESVKFGVCHGDIRLGNFIFGEKVWLCDFELSGLGPIILDLAQGVNEFCVTSNSCKPEFGESFLTGYLSESNEISDNLEQLFYSLLLLNLTLQGKMVHLSETSGYTLNVKKLEALKQLYNYFVAHNGYCFKQNITQRTG